MNGVIAASRRRLDTEAPTAPGQPLATNICQTVLKLSWAASTDNIAVTGYNIYDSGSFHSDVGLVLLENITGRTAGSITPWTIKAYDAAANLSDASPETLTTQGVNVTSVTMNSTGQSTSNDACSEAIDTTRYLTGGDSSPSNGEVVYTNSCGTIKLNGGGNWYSDGIVSYQVSSIGVITNTILC